MAVAGAEQIAIARTAIVVTLDRVARNRTRMRAV
jgi:hypothetical protein